MAAGRPILDAWAQVLAARRNEPAVIPSGRDEQAVTFGGIESLAATLQAGLLDHIPPGALVMFQPLAVSQALEHCAALLLAAIRKGTPLLFVDQAAARDFAAGICMTFGASCSLRLEADGMLRNVAETGGGRRPTPPAWPGEPPAFLKLTSGTSGLPRAVLVSESALHADARNVMSSMAFDHTDRNLTAIPVTHSYGIGNVLLPLLVAGVPAVPCEDRTPRGLLAATHAAKATVFPGTPVLFQSLAGLDGAVLPESLRLCISAGALLRPAVIRDWRARFGLPIHSFYGSSECGGICYVRDPHPEDSEGFVGGPLDGVTLEPIGDPSIPCQYAIRSGALGSTYWPSPDPAVLGGGRFISADLIERLPGGGCVLRGRTTDTIEVGARKLDPRRVEMAVESMPGVAWALVFGVPSPRRGHDVIAAVVPDSGQSLTLSGVLAHVRKICEPWECPRDVWFLPAPPCNERGKISRSELAARYVTAQSQPPET